MRKLDVCLTAALTLAACSTAAHRPDADEKPIEIFTAESARKPARPFREVSTIDLYVEKWTGGEPSMDDFRRELEERARLSGADAVVDLRWSLKGTPDAGIYHVTGKGIAYSPRAGAPPPDAPATGAAGEVAAARPPHGDVEVLADPPSRPFTKVSHLDLYVEKRAAGEPTLDEVLPELKRQARLSGADAVMEVEWSLRGANDAGVYHVTATGIAYSTPSDGAAPSQGGAR